MKFTTLILLILGLALAGCASTHPGEIAEGNDKTLVVSLSRNDDLSDKFYLFYEYTLENKSPEWKDIQVTNVTFDSEPTEVLTGAQLEAWIEGAEHKLKASQYNRDLLLASMAAVGGVAALTSGNSNVRVAGAAVAVGSVAVSGATRISRAQDKANSGVRGQNGTVNVPKTHVFVPSKIAPESYIRRWIVIRAPKLAPVGARTQAIGNDLNTYKLLSTVMIDTKMENYVTIVTTAREKPPAEPENKSTFKKQGPAI